jgi:glycosyltransferase involved in cell wall biosynthesis
VKIIGIARIRNEQNVILNTLHHLEGFLDEVHIIDDASTDNSVEACRSHKLVTKVIENKVWESEPKKRLLLEGTQRQEVYNGCLNSNADWIYYFDADEYIEFDRNILLNTQFNAFKLRFFDYYITESDLDKHYLERKFLGGEYREILTLFKASSHAFFSHREPTIQSANIGYYGNVRHYGKAISVKEWESTCDYYINSLYEDCGNETISEKWAKRKGKAIHTETDFKTPLIEWKDINNKDLIYKIN